MDTALQVIKTAWHSRFNVRNITQKVIDFNNEIRQYIEGKFYTVIDFGCGTAKNTTFLMDVFKARKYIGYDLIDFVIAENRKKYPNVEFVVFDEDTKLEKADCIFSSFVLQHINDKDFEMVLGMFRKALKPKGKIYIINCIDTKTNTGTMFFRNKDRHNYFFNKAKLKSELIYHTKINGSTIGLFEVTK